MDGKLMAFTLFVNTSTIAESEQHRSSNSASMKFVQRYYANDSFVIDIEILPLQGGAQYPAGLGTLFVCTPTDLRQDTRNFALAGLNDVHVVIPNPHRRCLSYQGEPFVAPDAIQGADRDAAAMLDWLSLFTLLPEVTYAGAEWDGQAWMAQYSGRHPVDPRLLIEGSALVESGQFNRISLRGEREETPPSGMDRAWVEWTWDASFTYGNRGTLLPSK